MNTELIANILLRHHANRDKPDAPYSQYRKIVDARDQVIGRFQPELSQPESITAPSFGDSLSSKVRRLEREGERRVGSNVKLAEIRTRHERWEQIPSLERPLFRSVRENGARSLVSGWALARHQR